VNAQAEEAVLGAIILVPQILDDEAANLTPNDFSSRSNRGLFAAMRALRSKGERIDALTLATYLRDIGEYGMVGGGARLTHLGSRVPTTLNVGTYVELVLREARRREATLAMRIGVAQLDADPDNEDRLDRSDPDAAIAQIMSRLSEIQLSGCRDGRDHDARDLIDAVAHETAEAANLSTISVAGAPVSCTQLRDIVLPVWGYGQLTVIGARPGVGKTALALQELVGAAHHHLAPLLISVEMTARQIAHRIVTAETGISHHRLITGTCTPDDTILLESTRKRLRADLDLRVVEAAGMPIDEICRRIRHHVRTRGTKVVAVDYLQIVKRGSRDDVRVSVMQTAYALGELAKQLNIAVLALSQLNRTSDSDRRAPRLSDLRESGAIEEVADVVLLLHDVEKTPNRAVADHEMLILKNRYGRTGRIEVGFQRNRTLWCSRAMRFHREPEDDIEIPL